MSTVKMKNEPPLFSKDICDDLLHSISVSAFRAHKSFNQAVYQAEINNLAGICACLLTYYNESPQSIIAHMEAAMETTHNNEIHDINSQINHLFHLRKQAPANTSYGEQEIIKITTKINALEELKVIPFREVIESIIHTSLEKAVKVIGAQIPANFNLNQYEYIPVGEKS